MKINVIVYPNSGRQEIQKISNEEYKVFLKKSAEANKANLELVKLLTYHFKQKVRITKGRSYRKKEVELI